MSSVVAAVPETRRGDGFHPIAVGIVYGGGAALVSNWPSLRLICVTRSPRRAYLGARDR